MTSYEDRMERIVHLRAQATKDLADLQGELDKMIMEYTDPCRGSIGDDGVRYTDIRGPVAGGIHVERFLRSMFNVSGSYPMQYHLSGLKVKDLYNRYRSYMRTEGLEERIMTLPDLRAYICRTYGMSHVRVVYGESDTARSWGEFRIGD